MSKWKPYNPNPKNARVGDCSIRAITKALNSEWETVFAGVMVCACALSDMPSANHVWGSYLRQKGFHRYIVNDREQDAYTVEDFCMDNPNGIYILAIDGHVVCVQDGYYYDTWDSGQEIPIYYWERR